METFRFVLHLIKESARACVYILGIFCVLALMFLIAAYITM